MAAKRKFSKRDEAKEASEQEVAVADAPAGDVPSAEKRKRKPSVKKATGAEFNSEDEQPARKARGGRASKAVAPAAEDADVDEGEEAEAKAKPKRGAKKPEPELYERYSEALRPPKLEGPATRLCSFNVAGLRGALKKDTQALRKLIDREQLDVLCLQETKISHKHVAELLPQLQLPAGWHASWACSTDKAGYSGVATLSRVAPISTQVGLGVPEMDGEGRLIVSEFNDFYLVNTYVPNSGAQLARLDYRTGPDGWDATLAKMVNTLQEKKPVIVLGDLNCCHKEIDIARPKTNQKSAGFTPEERASLSRNLLGPRDNGGCGMIDTFRRQHPNIAGYTYFSARVRGKEKFLGWRLDYVLTSQELEPRLYDSWILFDVEGSDHIPLGLVMKGALEGV